MIMDGEHGILEGPMFGSDNELANGTWKFGEFGDANPEVAEETGKNINNVHINMYKGLIDIKGILSDDGKKITFWSPFGKELDEYYWLSEEEVAAFKDSGDSHDAPPSHYEIRPEYQGKFIFLSGGPGLGKSTTGHILSKMAGFVYYEADCFMNGSNPYLPPDAKDPTVDAIKQKPLKGIPQDRLDKVGKGSKDLMAMVQGDDYDIKNIEDFYSAMCENISFERKRMGGDWVIAQAVPLRSLRDMMKKQLGPDLLFVILNMSKEDQEKRIKMRHGEDENADTFNEMLMKAFNLFEPAADDEENAINVLVSSDMTREEVAEKILNLIA